jgi:hypothetical protein
MAWQLTAQGLPAALITQVQALTSGSGSALEVAQVARLITALVAELNSFPANQNLEINVQGIQNFDGERVTFRIQPVGSFTGQSTFPLPQSSAP